MANLASNTLSSLSLVVVSIPPQRTGSPALTTGQRMPKPHWLAGGSRSWSPDVVITFDTGSTELPEDEGFRHIFLCWDAVVTHRHGSHPDRMRRKTFRGEEPRGIADVVEACSEYEKQVWIFAHNLGFDLTISQLPAILATRGWEIEAYGMSKESNWWVLKRDGRKVIIADSWSWLPEQLDNIGREVGRRTVSRPGTGEGLQLFHRVAMHQAAVLSDLMCGVMDWWDDNHLGRWAITGAGCGWQAMRTLTGPKKIVVGPEPERTTFERTAVYGGRKEVFRVGEVKGEWCADYDFQGAYPTIAAHHRLPVHPGVFHKVIPSWVELRDDPSKDYIANVQITTDVPCVPVRIDHEVWWPVGTFSTVLTGVEVDYARTRGAAIVVGSGYVYRLDFALRPWAIWCLALLHGNTEEVPAPIRRMAKGWSRSVIGRFAGHTSRITAVRPAIGHGVRLSTGHNLDTGRPLEVLTIGDREITTEHDLDGSECFPAVLAFVEAHCRTALGAMIDSRDPSRVLQCNTDGWWERHVVAAKHVEMPGVPFPHTVVRKARVSRVVILGPDHLTTPQERRTSGIPNSATQTIDSQWSWHDWPGMRWQWERNANGEFLSPRKSLTAKESYAKRWVLETGETVPVAVVTSPDGTSDIARWSDTPGRRNGDTLAPYQDPRLAPLTDLTDTPPIILETHSASGLGRDRLGPRLFARRR